MQVEIEELDPEIQHLVALQREVRSLQADARHLERCARMGPATEQLAYRRPTATVVAGTSSGAEVAGQLDKSNVEAIEDPLYAWLFEPLSVDNAGLMDMLDELQYHPFGRDLECTGRDLVFASSIAQAYPQGFQGAKKVQVALPSNKYVKQGGHMKTPQSKPTSMKITCDKCGKDILKGAEEQAFWFCRNCLGRKGRFELCAACYDAKFSGVIARPRPEELPDHFRECHHASLQECSSIADAYPDLRLRRLNCDLCKRKILDSQQRNIKFFKCRSCEDRGRRFELCGQCDRLFR